MLFPKKGNLSFNHEGDGVISIVSHPQLRQVLLQSGSRPHWQNLTELPSAVLFLWRQNPTPIGFPARTQANSFADCIMSKSKDAIARSGAFKLVCEFSPDANRRWMKTRKWGIRRRGFGRVGMAKAADPTDTTMPASSPWRNASYWIFPEDVWKPLWSKSCSVS